MPYIELLSTLAAIAVLAWVADLVTGRRALANMMIVGATGGVAGAFLALRVFAVSEYDSWIWPIWAVAAAVIAMLVYFMFRNKR
ncbi:MULTISPECIES: transglycosylase [unclassified Brevundimonas]|uniref:transglycosylase n=1 Tax=unclassified Brevundimonas TaxID=2622653 RepID=UPI0025B87D70|nr:MULTISPECIES: transglycosylase [unclassified Brevundimonas]